MTTQKRDDGLMVAVAGQSRWGKTYWVKQQIKPAPRALCWDPRGEFLEEGFTLAKSLPELAGLLREIREGEGQITYWGPLADFNGWCDLAYHWGQLWPAAFCMDEMSDVTHSGKADDALGEFIRKGLFFGNHIYGLTQRPQETTKTLWSNASIIHSHGFIAPDDQLYIAKRLGVPVDQVASLKKYEWLERAAGDVNVKRGGG